jgi:hypothetical protein
VLRDTFRWKLLSGRAVIAAIAINPSLVKPVIVPMWFIGGVRLHEVYVIITHTRAVPTGTRHAIAVFIRLSNDHLGVGQV